MGPLPAGTVTFLFTDIESSSERWESRTDEMASMLSRHDDLLRACVDRQGGVVFKHLGDGLAAAFSSAVGAVRTAVEAQAALQAEPWPGGAGLAVRMGLHTGEAMPLNGDYYGPVVNRAARVMGAANGAQIVCSSTTSELSRSVGMRDVGEHELRGVGRERLYLVLDGYRVDERSLRAPVVDGNLPRPPTSFVGRQRELTELCSDVAAGRLVTLSGPGGIGKTRLAIEAAWSIGNRFADGAWLCELAPIADADSVAPAVAALFGLRPQERLETIEAVVEGLAGRELLLVLDNCEHVLDSAAELVERLQQRAKSLAILCTSRAPLGVPGEHVRLVPPLEPTREGVELFIDRAQSASAGFDAVSDRSSLEAICGGLDGMPLAIELAAGWVRSLTPADLASRLDDRFRLLRTTRRSGVDRHQTLLATVDWSYQLLDDAEQQLFDRLAVFAGSFDLPAAEAVCGGDSVDEADVVGLLARLVDKSMVIADTESHHARYRLLETLRQYGEAHLSTTGQLAQWRDRHLSHYLQQARRARAEFEGDALVEGSARFVREWDNIRAAISWAVSAHDATKATALIGTLAFYSFWGVHHEPGQWAEQILTLDDAGTAAYGVAAVGMLLAGDKERALQLSEAGAHGASPTSPDQAPGCTAALFSHWLSGRADEMRVCAARLELAVGDSTMARAVLLAARAVDSSNDPSRCAQVAADFALLASGRDNPILSALTAYTDGLARASRGQIAEAMPAYRRALALAESANAQYAVSITWLSMLNAASRLHDDDVLELFHTALTQLHAVRDWANLWVLLEELAIAFANWGNVEPAAVILGYLEAHDRRLAVLARQREKGLLRVRTLVDAESLFNLGASFDRDGLFAFAIESL